MEIDIVIMASGRSTRFGKENKLLQEMDGRPVFEHVIDNTIGAMMQCMHIANRLIVVSCYKEVKEYCHQIVNDIDRIVIQYVENHAPLQGISHSVVLGLAHVRQDRGVMFLAADQPYLKADELFRFIGAYVSQEKPLGIMCDSDGAPVSPCIFTPEYKDELVALRGDRDVKSIIKRYTANTFFFYTDSDWQQHDNDAPEDIRDES